MTNLSEAEIKKLTEEAVRQLGGSATPASIEKVVREALDAVDKKTQPKQAPVISPGPENPVRQQRIIVTAFGKNRSGILAGLTNILARHHCDILDLSQKILQDFFTIMLLVDIAECDLSFEEIKKNIVQKGEELDLKVIVQHEDIFNAMHRI